MRRIQQTLFMLPVIYGLLLHACQQASPAYSDASRGPVRNAHQLVYHAQDSVVYLFGGATEKEVMGDLRRLKGTNWEKVSTAVGPPPRTFAGLVYDPAENRLILFGGSKVLFGKETTIRNLLNDMWEFKEGQWEQLFPEHYPSARAEMSMAYDEEHNRIVLFGGYNIRDDEYIKLGDTWEFRNNDWHQLPHVGPSARHGAPMDFNPKSRKLVIFGGSTVDRQYGEFAGETWTLDGQQWKKMNIDQPAGIFNAAMTFDQKTGELVRFGGWDGESRVNDTFYFSENTWSLGNLELSPTPRNHHAMVYDRKHERILMYGGHNGASVFGDLWAFVNGKWELLIEITPMKRVENRH